MCGIYFYKGTKHSWESLESDVSKIAYRGPDNTHREMIGNDVLFSFHRLAIMGTTAMGNQPMKHPNDESLTLICNGEIYNYKDLAEKYGLNLVTDSDCEIILCLFKQFGIVKTVQELDGVFMFVIHDANTNQLFAGRDPMGIRPGFFGSDCGEFMIASEAKPMVNHCSDIMPFSPGTWWCSDTPDTFNPYFHYNGVKIQEHTEEDICDKIHSLLTDAVKKRLMAEREIGCLLSGGLDSSLISALVNKYYEGPKLNTFSIGLPGSIDLEYAQHVADHLGTKHHQIEVSEYDFLNAIETVIYNIESYDTTTVRASVGNYLVSKFISENSDCKVIFNGDGADEVCCGYVYLKNAPTPEALQKESEKLVEEIHYFDVLRSDRSISSNGLEARTPFLDIAFVKYCLSIPAELKTFDGVDRLEKYLLRKAFDGHGLLPDNVLWRRKCAFSDGVSSQKNSWHQIIKTFIDEKISDAEFNRESVAITHCKPMLKESYYYRKIFESHFEKNEKLIPHFWMPNWTTVIDPSARELQDYQE
ncbi:MAG: asparagine synthetase B [Candidatus Marinimicrobia bacterium]|nr:asparagine synthetase B [Candidatus Neomarinimicrobiota bacterium]